MTQPIRATTHAVDRARLRFPDDFRHAAHAAICITLCREVAAGIAAGQTSRNLPRWAKRSRFERREDVARRKPSARYVWTEDRRRLFIVLRQSTHVIVTVLKVPAPAPVAA